MPHRETSEEEPSKEGHWHGRRRTGFRQRGRSVQAQWDKNKLLSSSQRQKTIWRTAYSSADGSHSLCVCVYTHYRSPTKWPGSPRRRTVNWPAEGTNNSTGSPRWIWKDRQEGRKQGGGSDEVSKREVEMCEKRADTAVIKHKDKRGCCGIWRV